MCLSATFLILVDMLQILDRNRRFWRACPNLTRSNGKLDLGPMGSKLTRLKFTFNAENFICRLSWSISSDFGAVHSWNVCGGPEIAKKIKPPSSRSFKVTDVCTPEKLVSSACYDKQKPVSICNRSHARRAIVVKERYLRGYPPLWWPRSRGICMLAQRHEIFWQEIRDTVGYHTVKTRPSLYLTWVLIGTGLWLVTDTR